MTKTKSISNARLFTCTWQEQVLCVRRFEDENEALEAANTSDFGLAAAVMSSDQER